jgi:hypothetical protein
MAQGNNCAALYFFLFAVLFCICGCEAAVALQAFKPCHMPYTPFTRAVESPCYSVIGQLPQNVQLRQYAPDIDNGATVISANVSAALQPWTNGLEITANHMFEYFTGPGNSKGESLTAYLTAPLMFRPAGGNTSDAPPWFVDMVLQPSVWGRDSQPPGPARGFVQVLPFGQLSVAVCKTKPNIASVLFFCNLDYLNRRSTDHSKARPGRRISRRVMHLCAPWCHTLRLVSL